MKKDLFYFYKRETKLCQGGIQEHQKYDFRNEGFSNMCNILENFKKHTFEAYLDQLLHNYLFVVPSK